MNVRIRCDAHGPYLRADGHVFRPQWSKRTKRFLMKEPGFTLEMPDVAMFAAGERVYARRSGETHHATVCSGDRVATWWSHGAYVAGKSEDSWMPMEMVPC